MDETYVLQYPELEHSHFWWKIRRELVGRLLAERGALVGACILDIGCGAGLTLRQLADSGAARVEGIEIDPAFEDAAVTEPGVVRYGDFLEMEIGDRYDVVLMMDVLEHLEDEATAVKRVTEVLEPGGVLVLTVPAYGWLWSGHDEVNMHFRRYTRRSVRQVLEDGGLVVEQCGYMFAGLVLPKFVLRWWEQLTKRSTAQERVHTGGPISRLAEKWFRTELGLALKLRSLLPFGTSVVAVARKP